jgi:hypothetical protein
LDDDDFGAPEETEDNSAIQQMREELKRLKKVEKEHGVLAAFKQAVEAEKHEAKVKEAFKEAGLKERWANLYLKENSDSEVTSEGIKAFAEEYELLPANQDTAVQEVTEQAIAPVPGGAPPSAQPMTREAFEDLMRTNPTQAFEVARKQGVEWKHEQSRELAEKRRALAE